MQLPYEYDAYRHFAEMLERSGTDWLLAMYEVYFDDSGTHTESPLAIAACYISTKNGWRQFVDAWNEIRSSEGFEEFHMADFAAYHDKSKKPFCDWDHIKRKRVYRRIAQAVNENKRIGIAIAIPQQVFNRVVPELPERLKLRFGTYPYTAAVKWLMGSIKRWRERYSITLPMQYVFDQMTDPKAKAELTILWDAATAKGSENELWSKWYGIESPNGYGFQDKRVFLPLHAPDILAWQHNSHMRNVIMQGKDELAHTHEHYRILREDQEMDLSFMTEEQFRKTVADEMAFRPGEEDNVF